MVNPAFKNREYAVEILSLKNVLKAFEANWSLTPE